MMMPQSFHKTLVVMMICNVFTDFDIVMEVTDKDVIMVRRKHRIVILVIFFFNLSSIKMNTSLILLKHINYFVIATVI